jgi:ArsR family transcriptional regulator, lead/cadmium/zinc/bismuth-responsive transcriptional repressor
VDSGARPATETALADAAALLAMFADPSRLRLLLYLRHREANVGELSGVSGQSQSAVSHALRLLLAHRLVEVRRHGRQMMYTLTDPRMVTLLGSIVETLGIPDLRRDEHA